MKLNFIVFLFGVLALITKVVGADPGAEIKISSEQRSKLDLLHLAIQEKDLEAFKRSLVGLENLNHQYPVETLLTLSADKGYIRMVEMLIEAGVDLDATSSRGTTALMKAAFKGNERLVELLIKSGANLRIEHPNGFEAFDWALESRNQLVLKHLIKALIGADASSDALVSYALGESSSLASETLSIADKEKQSLVLVAAVIAGNFEGLEQLLAKGLDPDLHNMTGYAALPLAVRLKRVAMVKLLLERGANIDLGNNGNDEASALNQAARAADLNMVKLLLKAGASVNKQNARGYSALHLASAKRASEVVNYLLAKGADPGITNQEGFTPFDFAYQTGDKDLINQFLIDHLSPELRAQLLDVNQADGAIPAAFSDDPKILIFAIVNHVPSLKKVSEKAYQLASTKSVLGYFPANYAARFQNLDALQKLSQSGANFNQKALTGYQTTPLMDASRENSTTEVIQYLLEQNAWVNELHKYGDPAINWATFYGHKEIVPLLLGVGADPTIKSEHGYDAIRTAKEQKHSEILKLVLEHQSNSEKVSQLIQRIGTQSNEHLIRSIKEFSNHNQFASDGRTLLIAAIQNNQTSLVSYLIANQANPNQASSKGYLSSPLMQAVAVNNIQIITELLETNLNLNQLDRMGDPAINWASYYGHSDAVKLLLKKGADPTIKSVHGNAFDIALRRGHRSIATLLQGKFISHRPNKFELELFAAVEKKDFEQLSFLSGKGMTSAKNQYGDSILTFATNKQCLACVELLLNSNQQVDQVDSIGFTGLMIAARNGDANLVRLFIKNGADLNHAASPAGMRVTPLILAATHGREEIIKLLINHGADLDQVDIVGNTPLLWALSEGQKSSAEILKKMGANSSIKNRFGFSANQLIEQNSG